MKGERGTEAHGATDGQAGAPRGGADEAVGAARGAASGSADFSAPVRRGLRIYGALDLAFAALYVWLGFFVAPGRAPAWNFALATVVLLLVASGAALGAGWRRAWLLAVLTQIALLALCATAIVLIVASAAYLRGIYGPVGKGMALIGVLVAALLVELCGLLPLFQLRFLLRDDVRDALRPRRG